MLFLSILSLAAGWTLMTAGVKGGQVVTADGTPAWRKPWQLWVDQISGVYGPNGGTVTGPGSAGMGVLPGTVANPNATTA